MSLKTAFPDTNLEEIINKVLVANALKSNRDNTRFHSSEFKQCHRKVAYKYYEAKGFIQVDASDSPAPDPKLQRIFDNGHYLHERLRKNVRQSGLLVGLWKCLNCEYIYGKDKKLGVPEPDECTFCDTKKFEYMEVDLFDEETWFGGHVDAFINCNKVLYKDLDYDQWKKNLLVIDFKSIRQEMFNKLSQPKEDHYSQMQIYLYLTGLSVGKFLYENKNDQSFKEFIVLRDDDFIAARIKEAKYLKTILLSKNSKGQSTLPPRPYKKDNTPECIECKYRTHCWLLRSSAK